MAKRKSEDASKPVAPTPKTKQKSRVTPGGTAKNPSRTPAVITDIGIIRYPYPKLVDGVIPSFAVFGDKTEYWKPYTKDQFHALAEAIDREYDVHGDFVEEARKTPTYVQEVYRDVQRQHAGTLFGTLLDWRVQSGFTPNVERWQIPDPDAPQDGENVATWVQVYGPPGDQIHHLWAPDGGAETVWTHTWRAMYPEGMITCPGGKLPAANQRAGLAAAYLCASNTRELLANPDNVNQLMRLWLAHQSRNLG